MDSMLLAPRFARIAALLALALLAAPVWAQATPPADSLPRVRVTLHGQRFDAQVAATDNSRAYGLMNRTKLAPNQAMLFVFRHASPRWFWMKDTKIPLDMLFFDARRKLISMQLDARPCTQQPCTIYPSDKPAMYVLEVAAGVAQRDDMRVGDEMRIEGAYGPVQ